MKRTFMNLGLSDREALLLQACLTAEKISVEQLARRFKWPRGTVNDALLRLVRYGYLALRHDDSRRRHFRVNTKQIISRLRRHAHDCQKAITHLRRTMAMNTTREAWTERAK